MYIDPRFTLKCSTICMKKKQYKAESILFGMCFFLICVGRVGGWWGKFDHYFMWRKFTGQKQITKWDPFVCSRGSANQIAGKCCNSCEFYWTLYYSLDIRMPGSHNINGSNKNAWFGTKLPGATQTFPAQDASAVIAIISHHPSPCLAK